MIFVRDKGRMCNNILQFGHVYAWAREHDRKAVSMRFAYKYLTSATHDGTTSSPMLWQNTQKRWGCCLWLDSIMWATIQKRNNCSKTIIIL